MKEWELGREILERAKEATGVAQVAITRMDPETKRVRIFAYSGQRLAIFNKGLSLVRRRFENFDLLQVTFDADCNEMNRQVYLEGKTVEAPLKELSVGVVHPYIVEMSGRFLGTKYGLACPLIVDGRVYGALGFNSGSRLGRRQRMTCEAFADQAALTIENSLLADELSGRIEELEDMRRGLLRSAPLISGLTDRLQEPISFSDLTLDPRSRAVTRGGEALELTPIEYNLAYFLLSHAREAVSREQLGREVWGFTDGSPSNFVDVTMMRLRKKLEATGRPRLIHSVRGYGYVLRLPGD